jgi:hypothetical protein
MSRLKCKSGCNAIMVQVIFDLYCATNVPAWSCTHCGQWLYSEQVIHVYMNQLYVAKTTKHPYEEVVGEFLMENT